MSADRFILRGERVVLSEGVQPADIVIEGETIVDVCPPSPANEPWIDAGSLVVLPGLVDTHVHVNEPGRTDWEGFETATRAAAAGGVTTIIDMPLNAIPATTTREGLAAKVASMSGKLHVDVGLWGGVVPGNVEQLTSLFEGGVLGFKAFMVPSGVPEFPESDAPTLSRAMAVLAELGAPLLVHAEDPAGLVPLTGRAEQPYAEYLASRPVRAETLAIERILDLSLATGCRVHVVHLAAADGIALVAAARRRGAPVSVETCPHYLTFDAESIADGATVFKCAPPIRESEHRDALWDGLLNGEIDLVVTDHSPCPPGLKRIEEGNFETAWGGIASLELTLAATWTAGRERGCRLADLARWMSARPAGLAGLGRKGAIAPGRDADLVVWDPDDESEVRAGALHQRHPMTPYAGRRLRGAVRRTIVRGRDVYVAGEFGAPSGRWLKRGGR